MGTQTRCWTIVRDRYEEGTREAVGVERSSVPGRIGTEAPALGQRAAEPRAAHCSARHRGRAAGGASRGPRGRDGVVAIVSHERPRGKFLAEEIFREMIG